MLSLASRHRHTVCAASHSMSRTYTRSDRPAAPPVDPAGRVALHERAVLPERVAHTHAAAAVHALRYCGGDALGGDQQRG